MQSFRLLRSLVREQIANRMYKARAFRERAKELRKVAFGLESEQGREALLIMADEYESIAARIEHQKPD
jgi:hypothetical protein